MADLCLCYVMPCRQELYLSGGLLSVTSRILVVEMLHKRIPTHLITGIVILHAKKASPTLVEAFIVLMSLSGMISFFVQADEKTATDEYVAAKMETSADIK
ncbi:unnamed protein product [Tilletia laevis]|uniref:Uncharacterized protein n=2 Tax=Tilletia caries TaxID=13290 RepID=A0ABN7IM41_9BASI|nr:hypothetical protein CF335_g4628 [Tilletia laevis]CAD6884667.1 unnamed protein product [Tilletia caries]CAD6898968.1 unnamed protein product [Tilletia caries]CAD6914235.1 unnamed protein product [Tilletia laevis]CAD7067612.1 unnamed protein product [Tilletia caries]